MKKTHIVMIIMLVITSSIFAIVEADCHIPNERLPWTDSTNTKLQWEYAGCLDSIPPLLLPTGRV